MCEMINYPTCILDREDSLGMIFGVYGIATLAILFITLTVVVVSLVILRRRRSERKKEFGRKDIEGSLASCDPLLQNGAAIQDLFEFSLSGSGQGA